MLIHSAAQLLTLQGGHFDTVSESRTVSTSVGKAWEQENSKPACPGGLGQGKILACTLPQAQVKMRQNPTRQVHALLAGVCKDRTLSILTLSKT
jgi:hypothetical protein